MANIQIIGVPQSNYVWVVRMACEEKGVPYDIVPARPHTPDVDALHPLGKIPGMRHGDVELCESKAIVTYIDKTFPGPKLIPEDARGAAEVEKWVSLVNTSVDPCLVRTYLLSYFFPKTADGKPDRAAIDGVLPAMQKQIGLLDKAVAKTGYLAGDGFTLADINLLPILHYVQRCPEGTEMVKAAPNLAGYFARHAERPSFKASTPPPPPPK
jgi:glutathione S-transferase